MQIHRCVLKFVNLTKFQYASACRSLLFTFLDEATIIKNNLRVEKKLLCFIEKGGEGGGIMQMVKGNTENGRIASTESKHVVLIHLTEYVYFCGIRFCYKYLKSILYTTHKNARLC